MTPLGRVGGRERRRRTTFIESAARHVQAVGVEHAAGIFIVPPDDETVFRKVFLNGDRSDFVVLERAVTTLRELGFPCAGAFVDVGANLGTTTLAALRLHGFSSAIACEPDPINARFLRATVAVNGLDDQVHVVEAAIADSAGQMVFASPAAGQGRKTGRGGLGTAGETVVQATTLDILAESDLYDPAEVGLVWMDAQGSEGLVLQGANRLLRARAPMVSAFRPKRLAKLDGLDAFLDTVTGAFSRFVDLRSPSLKPDWRPAFEPIGALAELPARRGSTDVLLIP